MQSLINLYGDHVVFDVGHKKNQRVKIVGTHKNPWFCGKDVCEILEYKDIQNVLFKHVKPKYKKDLKTLSEKVGKNDPTFFGAEHLKNITYHSGKAVYLDRIGLSMLLQKSKVSNPSTIQAILDNPIIKELGVDLNLVLVSKEQEYIGTIVEAFHDLKSYKQFTVGSYRIDLYFPDQSLAIECDEFNHTDRDPQYEKERQSFLENELKCKFIRFNPDSKYFSIHKVVKMISEQIMQQKLDQMEGQHKYKVQQMEEQHKYKVQQMEEQIRKLKIENKFLDGFYKAFNGPEKSEGEDSVG